MQAVGSGTERGVMRRSPLHAAHVALGARLVDFGGWEMPLSYGDGTVAEHRACRTAAAVFDVSHLGTVRVEGGDVFDRLQIALCNDLRKIGPGRAQYSQLLDDDGSVLDDVIVWWTRQHEFDVMPNAANTARVREAVGGTDVTDTRAVIAVQGPLARAVVAQVAPAAAAVGRMKVATFEWDGEPCTAAGTGYTGEDGVECAVPAPSARSFWSALLSTGAVPAGLGARDTLRLEAGLPLHGHELGPGVTPLQAGLGWVVGWNKAEFRGRDALERERTRGPQRQLRGLLAEGRQPPRAGDRVMSDGKEAGLVTSGNFSPMRQRGIALALVDTSAELADGDGVTAEVRGRQLPALVVPTRFWPVPEKT
ncbi:MAG TPA: glycine cleavage system aminomethyltransferase GcvT [Acidimicrobiales bacterium]|nr:glycine cleavage system aminomethyltransferase GcvT [Acidimicrobiales bacterium]